MDTEKLRTAINSALEEMSAEAIAALAGGTTAKSVLNFSSGATTEPRHATREALERFVDLWDRGLRVRHTRMVREGAVDPYRPGATPSLPPLVRDTVRRAQHEQARWIQDFAARLLEAHAAEIRAMSAINLTEEEVDGDAQLLDQIEGFIPKPGLPGQDGDAREATG